MRGKPQPIGDVLADLMARQGFANVKIAVAYENAWREAVGEMAAEYTRVGVLRRGALEVTVANSALSQELSFQKAAIVKKLTLLLPDQKIRNIRFKVGRIES